jgi:hypothetical protein
MSYETLESRAGKGPQVERVRRLFSIMAQTTWFGVITEVPFGVRITTNFNNGLFFPLPRITHLNFAVLSLSPLSFSVFVCTLLQALDDRFGKSIAYVKC